MASSPFILKKLTAREVAAGDEGEGFKLRVSASSQIWLSIWSPGSSSTTATCFAFAPSASVRIVAALRCTPGSSADERLDE